MLRLGARTLVVAALFCAAPGETRAASPDGDAAELVRQALQRETGAATGERESLLARARQLDPDYAPAHWHGGYVHREKQWVHFLEMPQLAASRETLKEYRRLRAETPDTFRGHVDLANWCRRQNLPAQERAHLTAALATPGNSNDAALRARLGFVLVDGRWQTRHDAQQVKHAARDRERAFREWQPKLERIARGLSHSRTQKTHAAQLKAIDDPAALPAMEAVFSHRDVATVLLLVEAYDGMPSHAAAEALARQAVYSPWEAVREEAAKKLQSKPPEAYAPALLASLQTPVESKIDLYVGNDGVRLTGVFFRENQDFRQLGMVDSQTRFAVVRVRRSQSPVPGLLEGFAPRAVENAVVDAELKAHATQRQVEFENDVARKHNGRVCEALTVATGILLPADPLGWWKWWLHYNELYEDGEKPCQYYCRHEHRTDPLPLPLPMSCLAAGTTVWTDGGAVAVETIKVGDLALSKDPASGELAYKPVLRTTVRPATQLHKVQTGDGEFHATGGHTFWISGHGWQKIRDVKPGMRFHAAAGPVELSHPVESGREEPTYNLVVADFHTYFVGESMLLSHDPTFAQPIDVVVPGLAAK